MLIVMTGATAGFGYRTARMLLAQGHEVVVGRRGSSVVPLGSHARALDLASLASVRAFAEALPGGIDALVLNAGMQHQTVAERSADGFELTFAVNHLAHYLLARLVLPKLRDGGRLVITSSGTHDPREKTGVPPPRHADARRLADPQGDAGRDRSPVVAGMRAYSSSKLCNLMTARALARHPEITARGIAVHAYDPGFIPDTRLGRAAPWVVRAAILPVLAALRPLKGMNSLEQGARGLAGLADGSIGCPRVYMSLRDGHATWPDPSDLAQDDTLVDALWRDSAEMVGLPA